MIDKWLVKYYTPKDIFTASYRPEQAVTSRKFVNESGNNLHVLFPPWHGGGKPYEKLIERLASRGDAVLAYYFHDELLKPDIHIVQASYAYLQDVVSTELSAIVSSHDYRKVHLVALSLGNPALATVTAKFSAFDSVSLICTASSLARSMWFGSRTQHIKESLEHSGLCLADIEDAWQDIAPSTHLNALLDKEVSIVVSTTDRVIPTRFQMEFVNATKESNIYPDIKTTSVGHYTAITKYCLFDKI